MAEYVLERFRSQRAWRELMASLAAACLQSYRERRKPEPMNRLAECSHATIRFDSIMDAFCECCGEDLT